MIIVKIVGGLGNQMFQYALYESLKNKNKDVKLDLTHFKTFNEHNGFELDKIFNLNFNIATEDEIKRFSDDKIDFISRVRRRVVGRKKSHYTEIKNGFDEEVFLKDDCFLVGCWQSEKYFLDIRDTILKKLKFDVKDEMNNNALNDIKNSNSVSLHVRRGDYLSDEKAAKTLGGVVGLDYYKNAIDLINKKIENPKFFVFSDDMKWVKDNLNIKNAVFVDFNRRKNSYKDMYLMSNCKNNIIANSSFSWWGAWLNDNENKIVIAPDKWIKGDMLKDIWCDSWIKCSAKAAS